MRRALFFMYGVSAHALFLAVYAYTILFVMGVKLPFMPSTVDAPASSVSVGAALAINILLLAVFGVQHSVMARPAFKAWWTQFVPKPIERSTYVMISNFLMIAMFVWWQPMDGSFWSVKNEPVRTVMWVLNGMGWLLVPGASLLINHFDLFGTRQVWMYLRGQEYVGLPFRTPGFYRYTRHPLYIGWLMAFWITPEMSVGHLVFAGSMTLYILIAIRFEERDLISHFGRKYVEYRERVPMLFPRPCAPALKVNQEDKSQASHG